MAIDRVSWDSQADYGSKPWLVGKALMTAADSSSSSESESLHHLYGHGDYDNGTGGGGGGREAGSSSAGVGTSAADDDALPEDRFHVNLPANVDKYTGLRIDDNNNNNNNNEDDTELPEDRFHRKDASSQFIINQREQAIKDKQEKYEK
jgi:hypothetical protein